ncbi:NAD-dependent dehydratase [Pedobacter yulinensis]|uniref:NAD-dependent dehydratase n=1 Tax=Pedobacter yulinensis TaxID=2126353 RepID=A0A2T3HN30_9SPHI|nr:NAD-dependent dehydratase [Pedobacter yulinensis]
MVGAAGVIGQNLVQHLLTLPDWNVTGVARRPMPGCGNVRYIQADLLDATDTRQKLEICSEVTHVFYAAYQDRPGWAELVAPNMTMLQNVVTAIQEIAPGLRHISLMQGYKVYGAHLGAFPTPARETDAAPMPPEFNYAQQQWLAGQQEGRAWNWSAIRPSVVGGSALHNPMNLALLIAVYASMLKELGLPLRFPGKPGAYQALFEMTDARLLAKGTVWAAERENAGNQAYNISNGDLFRWSRLWPRIADWFSMQAGNPLHMSLEVMMADKKQLWSAMQKKYGLVKHDYDSLFSWAFGDFVFSWDYDFLADGSKARRAGFHEYVDTEQMFFEPFEGFRSDKIIP